MTLQVLIATPSGPFGELIRLSLETDPEFLCSLLDNSAELWQTLEQTAFNAVIYDCSFLEPEPQQVVQQMKEDFPGVPVLLVPPETKTDPGDKQPVHADGMISRPFDASVLPELIRTAVEKKKISEPEDRPANPLPRNTSWWNAFQTGVQDTTASSGMVVQNGMVIACTPDTSAALQQQVTASVMRFWNPADSTDLMRYVKDLVTGQEWMMYATGAADNTVLVLLFLPQTPVTRVRSQTLNLAKEISPLLQKPSGSQPQPASGYLENAEPPRLHEILNSNVLKAENNTTDMADNRFPVEWFKEADLPDFGQTEKKPEDAVSGSENGFPEGLTEYDRFPNINPSEDIEKTPPSSVGELKADSDFDGASSAISASQSVMEQVQDAEALLSKLNEPLIRDTTSGQEMENIDLGNLQPVSLQPRESEIHEFFPPTEEDTTFSSMGLSSFEAAPIQENDSTQPELNAPIAGHEIEITRPVAEEAGKQAESAESEISIFGEASVIPEEVPEDQQAGSGFTSIEDTKSESGIETIPSMENYEAAMAVTPEPLAEAAPVSPLLDRFNSVGITEQPDAISQEPAEESGANFELPQESPAEGGTDIDLFDRMNQLQSAAQEEFSETVTVALIPRSENMILQRQIAGALNQTMSRLCLAFNWKLNNLTIRPTYMQWTVTIPSSLSPDDMIGIVRKETSQEMVNILSSDLSLPTEDEFWADQSMSAVGKDFVPSLHWQDFILRRKTREIA
ncbi:MAG: hypothetical protein GYA15_01165 [Leptolinea sp.]|jgi:hypothetical protein|nr:hypothetical protein [Leptolinea sp.]